MAAVAVLYLFSCALTASANDVLYRTDFESDPLKSGWWRGAYPGGATHGQWTDVSSVGGQHCIVVRDGWWASPRFEVEPLAYYRLEFSAMVEGKGYWFVIFYDQAGEPLDADHYSSIYPSEDWQPQECCFRARVNAKTADVRFRPIHDPLYVDDLIVEAVSRSHVARWADRVYSGMPPIDAQAVPRADKYLQRTMQKLRSGERLRIVMLGDSIINDTGNSAYDVLLERMYPGSRVDVVTSVRGGTGCTYYQLENRIQSYVLDLQPDLLMIGGISHQHDPEAVRNVIRQVRAKSNPDILLMSGAVSFPPDYGKMFRKLSPESRMAAIKRMTNYRPALKRVARQERVAYLDFRAHWDTYEQRVRKHPMWLRRDYVHANARGRQVLARVLEAFFRP
jgi:lysophospholipase L1-like esterase